MASQSNFDYVIIGAGSAGCILAARLSEDPATRVLVIEAGGPDRDPLIKIPLAWMKFVRDRLHDWKYDTEPEPNMAGRHFEITRGKVLGGSSSINAMAYVRGHAGDYDRWAGNGLPGWTYEDLLPRFKRTESWQGGGSELRGGGGPIQTRESTFRDPVIEA
ncbi:MAG: GMC family oxidoreductase N-terminal domain-containing protein, partial [Rhodospirillales bacterium]|nr:GMC family oxidoreductase N-terminal domain-containing protein [Rhodospirillales bacterium]